MENSNSPVAALPERVSTAMAGLHFLLPVGGLGCRLDNLHPAHTTAAFRGFPQYDRDRYRDSCGGHHSRHRLANRCRAGLSRVGRILVGKATSCSC
jgi:hypothetical protein